MININNDYSSMSKTIGFICFFGRAPVVVPDPLDVDADPLDVEGVPLDVDVAPLDVDGVPLDVDAAPLDADANLLEGDPLIPKRSRNAGDW